MRIEPFDRTEVSDENRRLWGGDRWDEVWDGALHVVPPPTVWHQLLLSDLIRTLGPLANARALLIASDVGFYDHDKNYRVPDLTIFASDQMERKGVVGKAALVIEILSPRDESRKKLPFYAARGVEEVWLLEPASRQAEVFVLRDGRYQAVTPESGVIRAPALGLELRVVDEKLRIAWSGGAAAI